MTSKVVAKREFRSFSATSIFITPQTTQKSKSYSSLLLEILRLMVVIETSYVENTVVFLKTTKDAVIHFTEVNIIKLI